MPAFPLYLMHSTTTFKFLNIIIIEYNIKMIDKLRRMVGYRDNIPIPSFICIRQLVVNIYSHGDRRLEKINDSELIQLRLCLGLQGETRIFWKVIYFNCNI